MPIDRRPRVRRVFTIPDALIDLGLWARLSWRAKALYPVLKRAANAEGYCTLSLGQLRKRSGINSRRHVIEGRDELVRYRLLEIVQRGRRGRPKTRDKRGAPRRGLVPGEGDTATAYRVLDYLWLSGEYPQGVGSKKGSQGEHLKGEKRFPRGTLNTPEKGSPGTPSWEKNKTKRETGAVASGNAAPLSPHTPPGGEKGTLPPTPSPANRREGEKEAPKEGKDVDPLEAEGPDPEEEARDTLERHRGADWIAGLQRLCDKEKERRAQIEHISQGQKDERGMATENEVTRHESPTEGDQSPSSGDQSTHH